MSPSTSHAGRPTAASTSMPARRARIRVVGVVDEPRRLRRALRLQPARHGRIEASPVATWRGSRPRHRGGRGAQRIRDVVRPSHVQVVRRVSAGGEPQRRTCGSRRRRGARSGDGAEVRAWPTAEADTRARGHRRATASKYGSSALRIAAPSAAARDHLALGARDAVEIAEAFEVLGAGVGDHADCRARDRASSGDLARWFAPISMTAASCSASSRSSVSGTPMWLLRLPRVARHGPACDAGSPRHLLHGGLAVAAGDADDGNREAVRSPACARRDSATRVGHLDQRQRGCRSAVDTNGADRAGATAASGDEAVAVEARAAQRDEQRARRSSAARIGDDGASKRASPPTSRPPHGFANCRRAALHAAARSKRCERGLSTSLNGRSLPTICEDS
jgi:hypothetical protein